MWLLDVSTFELKNFFGQNVSTEQRYAILSHTWEKEEVTFQDMKDLKKASEKAGYWKIYKTCRQAKLDGLEYAWVDTCCINKESSAELQEAINSMFEWYAGATCCYAYLSDVSESVLTESRWFTRGWTLQELIAPIDVTFYDSNWSFLGTRMGLAQAISRRTGIPTSMLGARKITGVDPEHKEIEDEPLFSFRWLGAYSIAQRMSWASHRETARIEDRAYSLLGIFGITMPLLYGEGRRSFIRLQEEILRGNPDVSILAWEPSREAQQEENSGLRFQTLFAPSPRCFDGCGSIRFHSTNLIYNSTADRTVSAIGIKVTLPIIPLHVNDHEGADFAAVLSCYDSSDFTSTITLKLISQKSMELGEQEDDLTVMHMMPYSMAYMARSGATQRTMRMDTLLAEQDTIQIKSPVILLRQRMPGSESAEMGLKKDPNAAAEQVWVRFSSAKLPGPPWSVTGFFPANTWNAEKLTFKLDYGNQHVLQDPANPNFAFAVGSVILRRVGIMDCKIIISFACPEWINDSLPQPEETKSTAIFFRLRTMEADEDNGCQKVEFYHHDLVHRGVSADMAAHERGENLINAKGVFLYEGTRLYDAAVLAVKPEYREIARRRVVILHIFDLTDMDQVRQLDEPSSIPINKRFASLHNGGGSTRTA